MLRFLWLVVVAFVVTIPLGMATLAVASVRSTSPWIDRIVRLWGRLLVKAAGVTLKTENMDRIDPAKRYVIVSNHYSYLDIPCILTAVPQPIRFMAKISLFKIPIFGWAIGRAGFIPIDRKNRKTAVKAFDLAAERIRKGNTIGIFPEEGRSRARQLRPFQRGAFLLAMKAERTIIPIALDSTYDIYPATRARVTPGVVTLKVGTPIETAGLKLRDKERLLLESRAQIETMLFGETAVTDPREDPSEAPIETEAQTRSDPSP